MARGRAVRGMGVSIQRKMKARRGARPALPTQAGGPGTPQRSSHASLLDPGLPPASCKRLLCEEGGPAALAGFSQRDHVG